MLVKHEREKLINAIIFFCSKTKYCGITKLFKLLYFTDFEHYKLTGRSITGLDYFAWKMGPVPVRLYNEIPMAPEPDLAEKVRITPIAPRKAGGKQFVKLEPKAPFNSEYFSKREMAIMTRLSTEYKSALAEDMVEATHLENLPWHQVYCVEGKLQAVIPYEYAFRKDEADFVRFMKKENDEIVSNYAR